MGSVNFVFVKEEKGSEKKSFSHPDWSDIQRTRIIHIQFSHQEIYVVKKNTVVYGMYFRPITSWT